MYYSLTKHLLSSCCVPDPVPDARETPPHALPPWPWGVSGNPWPHAAYRHLSWQHTCEATSILSLHECLSPSCSSNSIPESVGVFVGQCPHSTGLYEHPEPTLP